MKTSNFVLLALTLLDVLEASGKKGGKLNAKGNASRNQIPRTRAAETTEAPSSGFGTGSSSRPFPGHMLLMPVSIMNNVLESSARNNVGITGSRNRLTGAAVSENDHDDENGFSLLSSIDDDEFGGNKVIVISESPESNARKIKATRKRSNDDHDLDNFDENNAADALLSMSKSGGNGEVDLEDSSEKHKNKKERKEKKQDLPALLNMTENMLFNDTIRKYNKYFDERNMETVGCETLFKCMSNSTSPKLATYLIRHGARLADTEESAVIALAAKEEGEGSLTELFKILLEEDPISVAKIFIRAAGMTEADDETVDMFFFVLLVDMTESLVEAQTDLLISLIEVLAESDRMSNSFGLLLGDGDRIMKLFSKALKSGNASFIELVLDLELLRINDNISLSGQGTVQTLVSSLFGRIESKKIIDFIQKFDYDMKTSNDSAINPDGDILVCALAVRDLKSFKRLLLLGASLNVNVRVGEQSQLLADFVRENEQEFYDAIQSFNMGILQVELETEEAEEIDNPDLMLVAPKNM
jgi:triphosphoribosyl-dephospho-CoA synthetase